MKIPLLPTVLVLTLAACASAEAEDSPASRLSLKGLRGIAVRIDPIAASAQKDGLSASAIRTAVESRLRKGAIRVLTADQQRQTSQRACLVVRVATSKLSTGEHLYAIQVEVSQWVASLSDPTLTVSAAIPIPATTWTAGSVFGITTDKQLEQDAVGAVGKMAEQFIGAYHKANPSDTAFRFRAGRVR